MIGTSGVVRAPGHLAPALGANSMRGLFAGLLILAALHRPLAAQGAWTLTLDRGATSFSSTAHDTSSPPVRLVPWHPTLYTLRLERRWGRSGLGVGISYGAGVLAGRVEDVVVIPGLSLDLAELAPEVSRALVTTSRGATLRVQAGPLMDLWIPSGEDIRATFGGAAGATLVLPLSARWEVAVRGDIAVTSGEVTPGEASAEIIRARTLRRGRLGLGITRHL